MDCRRWLTESAGASLLSIMVHKKAPRLAVAFVVTISAGCGSATPEPLVSPNPPVTKQDGPENPDWVPNLGSVKEGFVRGDDGKCFIQHAANPPWMEPVDCETQKAIPEAPKPLETPVSVHDSNLPEAPKGWRVDKESDGSCRAYSPPPSCPRGARCNPPPPQTVKCPKVLPKDAEDPSAL